MKALDDAFRSPMAPWLRDFILEKRSVGYRYASEQIVLQRLDRFLNAHAQGEATLSPALLASWFARQPHESIGTQFARIGVTRQFVQFLLRHGVSVELPPVPYRRLAPAPFVAYIFNPEEIARLFSAVDHLRPVATAPLRHLVMPVLFRVLYGCGLRLSEALRLRVKDVDMDVGVLTILQSKFRKDRLVAVSPSLQVRLRRYHEALGDRHPDAVFFPAPHGDVYSKSAPYSVFRFMLRSAKIPHAGRGRGPRIHDLRHTFAVHRLETWYREHHDISSKLPVLATYLGHETLAGTQRYLQLTASLLPDLSASLEQRFGALIPRGTP